MTLSIRLAARTTAVAALLATGSLLTLHADPIRIGYVNVLDDAPVHVAYEAGFYEDEGLEVDLKQFASGTDLIKGIVSGRLDLGVLGFTNALTWASRGAELRIVGGAQRGFHSVLTRADSGIGTVAELKSRSLATQKQGSTADVVLTNVVLAGAGLTRRDLTMRYVSPAVAVQALTSGAVDAAFLFEPYARIAMSTAPVREIYEIGKVWPFPCMVAITSDGIWKEKRSTVESALDAQRHAIETIRNDPEAAARLITPYFIPDGYLETPEGRIDGVGIIEEALRANTYDWLITDQDLRRMKEIESMMVNEGFLTRRANVETILDLSWQEELE